MSYNDRERMKARIELDRLRRERELGYSIGSGSTYRTEIRTPGGFSSHSGSYITGGGSRFDERDYDYRANLRYKEGLRESILFFNQKLNPRDPRYPLKLVIDGLDIDDMTTRELSKTYNRLRRSYDSQRTQDRSYEPVIQPTYHKIYDSMKAPSDKRNYERYDPKDINGDLIEEYDPNDRFSKLTLNDILKNSNGESNRSAKPLDENSVSEFPEDNRRMVTMFEIITEAENNLKQCMSNPDPQDRKLKLQFAKEDIQKYANNNKFIKDQRFVDQKNKRKQDFDKLIAAVEHAQDTGDYSKIFALKPDWRGIRPQQQQQSYAQIPTAPQYSQPVTAPPTPYNPRPPSSSVRQPSRARRGSMAQASNLPPAVLPSSQQMPPTFATAQGQPAPPPQGPPAQPPGQQGGSWIYYPPTNPPAGVPQYPAMSYPPPPAQTQPPVPYGQPPAPYGQPLAPYYGQPPATYYGQQPAQYAQQPTSYAPRASGGYAQQQPQPPPGGFPGYPPPPPAPHQSQYQPQYAPHPSTQQPYYNTHPSAPPPR